jgi:gamma-glutamyl-gamma-aminobutyrate hydrolase PuuD
MTRKVFIVEAAGSGHSQVALMYGRKGWALTKDIEEADLVQFCGGSDVSPDLYNQHKHSTTHNDHTRDEVEEIIYTQAQELGIPCVGICRGGQFLHVMNGGEMWQDVDGHMGEHDAFLYSKILSIKVSSDHHQMMHINYDVRDKVIILVVAQKSKQKEKMCALDNPKPYAISRYTNYGTPDDDLEALYYPDTKCLCFQPHPEYKGYTECEDTFFHLLNNYVFDDEEVVSEVA